MLTLAGMFKAGRAEIVYRTPRDTSEGKTVKTASGRLMTPCPRWDISGPRKLTSSQRRQADWLRDNARMEAQSRGLYCTICDGYSDNELTPAEHVEATMLLWGSLVVDGRIVGLPESWDLRGGFTDDELAACPLFPTPQLIQQALLALLDQQASKQFEDVA